MRIENGKLILDTPKACNGCHGKGKAARPVDCSKCNGTGNGPRGGRNGCKNCINGKVYAYDLDCPDCVEKDLDPKTSGKMTRHDWVSKDLWSSLKMKVYRSSRPMSGNESILGLGCAFSCVDYGQHKTLSDDELIGKVRESSPPQICVICDKEFNVVDHMGIFCNDQGYSVRPCFDQKGHDAQATIIVERPEAEYLMVGNQIASEGGNGTLGALYDN